VQISLGIRSTLYAYLSVCPETTLELHRASKQSLYHIVSERLDRRQYARCCETTQALIRSNEVDCPTSPAERLTQRESDPHIHTLQRFSSISPLYLHAPAAQGFCNLENFVITGHARSQICHSVATAVSIQTKNLFPSS
jgi:hypothetical protein